MSILEVAILQVKPEMIDAFELAFVQAQVIISGMEGYVSHTLHRCLEKENQYILLVEWVSVSAHEEGFRQSPEYQEWKALLHHFYDPFPTVEHYERRF